ncbi:hypothetical protein ACTQ4P_18480 [Clostridium sporogenes]|uniref:hypothetical protein n=1 Tax=Clostridium sporogenes TaxID=1509 RepID=UPI002902B09C|nr:hypothetical protein [Clostridium botulinum]HDK7182935.1 hypothetical protein [Clostridium botulinum]HDK7236498.1 hypothetical protein [Clostridium botulinum]HDK7251176.1 hypothetical protein [Clostridium botulinum]HDK7301404.1 hypothetical protein [Clostridium botulinum]
MKKEEMLKMLLDDLHSMSGEQLVRDYKEKGINVVDYNSDEKGEVCLYEYSEGVLTGNTFFTESIDLIKANKYNCFEIEGVA